MAQTSSNCSGLSLGLGREEPLAPRALGVAPLDAPALGAAAETRFALGDCAWSEPATVDGGDSRFTMGLRPAGFGLGASLGGCGPRIAMPPMMG